MKNDLISREALKHRFAQITYIRFTADMGQGGFEMFTEKEIEAIIDNAPAVEHERPQGEWMPLSLLMEDRENTRHAFRCPFCRYVEGYAANFCAKCGAKLREAKNEK